MEFQTEPAMFNAKDPIYKVSHIDKSTGVVTLTGVNGSSVEVPLNSWGPWEAAHPLVGSKVQLIGK